MLLISWLLEKNTRSEGYMVNADEWKNFFVLHIDAEFGGVVVFKNICGNSKRYYIRLGSKQPGYNKKVGV